MKKIQNIALLCYFSLSCGRQASSEDLLSRYAQVDASDANSFLGFYAQGLKLNTKTQSAGAHGGAGSPTDRRSSSSSTGKIRAFFLSAMLAPDLKNSCVVGEERGIRSRTMSWDCIVSGMQALDEKRRSILYPYAQYHLAELATGQNFFNEAIAILRISSTMPPVLERKASLLKGRLLQFQDSTETAGHFRAHAEKYTDAESLYFAAAALEKTGDKKSALALAARVLEKPEADFAFAQSGLLVHNILQQQIYSLEDTALKIRLMEALRVAKDRAGALNLFQNLVSKKHSGAERILFTHYASRLSIDRGDFKTVARLIAANARDFLGEGNDKAALDICERLLKKKQFSLAETLFALNPPSKSRLQCRLRLAQRSGKNTAAVQKIAADYLQNFDPDSTLAERVFLRFCLPETKSKKMEISISCLEELRQVTKGKSTGAGARFYLARQYDTAGNTEKVRELLGEIASDYPDDYYFYRLLERPLRAQKDWAGSFKIGGDRQNRILEALVFADLRRAKNIGQNSQLKDLERDVEKSASDLDPARLTALLLFSADSREEARELLRGEDKLQIYENLIVLGQLSGRSDIALYGVKQWLREKKLRLFLYEIPPQLLALLYPTAYSAHVKKYAEKHHIDAAEVMALIRQESQFFPGALSVAKAQGLMQLMPATARLVAAKDAFRGYNLMKPEDNIRLGVGFMRDIKNHYAADFVGLAVAYNAGPGRYIQWRKKFSSDEDLFVEEIPFQETYQYVRILLADRAKYRALMYSDGN